MRNFELPLNLNEGYNRNMVTVDSELTNFPQWEKGLKWINESENGCRSLSDVEVITERDVLKDIGYTNLNFYKNSWKFAACKFKGKLYIRKFEEVEEQSLDIWGAKYRHWGNKFEELVMERDSRTKATYKMLKGNLGKRKVLLSAEVDAVTADGKHMEVKTCAANKLTAQIPLAWLQSHLGKVDVLYYGLNNKRGTVSNIPTEILVAQIPGRYLKAYEANAMIGFLGDVIDWLYNVLPDGDETWMLEYSTGMREIFVEYQGMKFMPEWYLRFIDNSGVSVEFTNSSPMGDQEHVEGSNSTADSVAESMTEPASTTESVVESSNSKCAAKSTYLAKPALPPLLE